MGENNRKSVILWLWAVPGGFGAIQKGRGLRPRPFWMAPKPPGTAQSHKMTEFLLFSPLPLSDRPLKGPAAPPVSFASAPHEPWRPGGDSPCRPMRIGGWQRGV